MRNLRIRIPMVLAIAVLSVSWWTVAARSNQSPAQTFTGELTDSICAKSGSHHEMMAKMQSMGRDKETCTKQCARIGAKFVLFDEASKRVYSLDDQAKPQQFAGRRVRVKGTLDGDKIRVTEVEAVG